MYIVQQIQIQQIFKSVNVYRLNDAEASQK